MNINKVRMFAEKSSDEKLPKFPKKINIGQQLLLKDMVIEEMNEFIDSDNIVDQADAMVDAIYYIMHFACKHGINLEHIFDIVHEANMNKIKNGVLKNKHGKILKPKGWFSPEPLIKKELERQSEKGGFS